MSGRPGGLPAVRLYARPDCHLCDEARTALEAMLEGGLNFELEEVDIDRDDRLLRSYLERIPVVEVGGSEVSALVFDAAAVRAALVDAQR